MIIPCSNAALCKLKYVVDSLSLKLNNYIISADGRMDGIDTSLLDKADGIHAHPEYVNPDLTHYVTDGELTTALATKADAPPVNDERYYTETEIDAMVSGTGGAIVGEIRLFAGGTWDIPDGWQACDGSTLSRYTYSALFAILGTAYGAPDSESFNVPSFWAKFPVGAAPGTYDVGATGGEVSHTLTINEMPQHDHQNSTFTHLLDVSQGTHNSEYGAAFATSGARWKPGYEINRGGDAPHENRPPYLAVNFIIFTGVYAN